MPKVLRVGQCCAFFDPLRGNNLKKGWFQEKCFKVKSFETLGAMLVKRQNLKL